MIETDATPLLHNVHSDQSKTEVELFNKASGITICGPGDHMLVLGGFCRIEQTHANAMDVRHRVPSDSAAGFFLHRPMTIVVSEKSCESGGKASFISPGIQKHGNKKPVSSE